MFFQMEEDAEQETEGEENEGSTTTIIKIKGSVNKQNSQLVRRLLDRDCHNSCSNTDDSLSLVHIAHAPAVLLKVNGLFFTMF